MDLNRFIEKYLPDTGHIINIPNKRLSKTIRQYKYIDCHVQWFDNEDIPESVCWEDVEGIGYGWLWLSNKDSVAKQRKSVIKWALSWHGNEPVYTYFVDKTRCFAFYDNERKYAIIIRCNNFKPLSTF